MTTWLIAKLHLSKKLARLSEMLHEVTLSVDFFTKFYDIIQCCHEDIVTKAS